MEFVNVNNVYMLETAGIVRESIDFSYVLDSSSSSLTTVHKQTHSAVTGEKRLESKNSGLVKASKGILCEISSRPDLGRMVKFAVTI